MSSKFTLDLSPRDSGYCVGSFDIGTINLAVCIIEHMPNSDPPYKIRQWQLINLLDQKGSKKLKCKMRLQKKRKNDKPKTCGSMATYWDPETGNAYCKTHKSKAPCSEDILERYLTTKNTNDLEFNQRLIQSLEELPELWTRCHEIILEGQWRSEMKKILYMIHGFFSYKITHAHEDPSVVLNNIKVVSSRHKLNLPADKLSVDLPLEPAPKGKKNYRPRKKLARENCPLLLQSQPYFLKFFKEHKKQDDLADSFLQGLWYVLSQKE